MTRIVPCGSQLWAIQHTWSTGTVVTRAGKFAKAFAKAFAMLYTAKTEVLNIIPRVCSL